MKRIAALSLAVFMAAALFGCGKNDGDLGKQTTVDEKNGYTLVQEVKMFKMNDDEKAMKNLKGVKEEGFKIGEANKTGEIETKADAIEIAKGEADVKYNSIRVAFDRTQGIWKVVFSNDKEVKNEEGTKYVESDILETVYVDEDGYTLAVYKGEVK